MMWVIVPHQGRLEKRRRFVIVPDFGMQQLPQRQSAKPSTVAWVPWYKAPDVCFSSCVSVWQMPVGQKSVLNGGLKPPP